MADNTKIQWTDATWNTCMGCKAVSAGCNYCYARRQAERFRGIKGHFFENGFDFTIHEGRLDMPIQWRKSRKIFVNSMGDTFLDEVPACLVLLPSNQSYKREMKIMAYCKANDLLNMLQQTLTLTREIFSKYKKETFTLLGKHTAACLDADENSISYLKNKILTYMGYLNMIVETLESLYSLVEEEDISATLCYEIEDLVNDCMLTIDLCDIVVG